MALVSLSNLTFLELIIPSNDLKQEGATIISEFLPEVKSLKSFKLDLTENNFGQEDALLLCESLS